MANINNNILVRGAKGKVGDQLLLRTRGKKTTLEKIPVQKNRPPTPKQNEKRDRFTYASLYAQGAMASKELKKKYDKKTSEGVNAYNIAFRDFLIAPVVKKINVSEYTGEPGSRIIIKATDDFRVIAVEVKIFNAEKVLIEQGNAVLDPMNRKHWIYTSGKYNSVLPGSSIVATAFDIPKNKGMLEVLM